MAVTNVVQRAPVAEPRLTINRAECDVVVTGTPIDLGRLIHSQHPIRHVTYELQEIGTPTLADVLRPIITRAGRTLAVAVG